MEEIAKLKLFIQEFENSNTPLTKPKKDTVIDKKPAEINQEDIIQELPPPKTQSQEIQQVLLFLHYNRLNIFSRKKNIANKFVFFTKKSALCLTTQMRQPNTYAHKF
jgi:hypothetical protein